MVKRLPAFLFLVVVAALQPAARADDSKEPIAYTVRIPSPETHYAEVTAKIPTENRRAIDLMMPVWSPGFYRMENYAGAVEDLVAKKANGETLAIDQPRKNRWHVETGSTSTVTVTYRVLCNKRSVTNNWVDEQYAILNGAPTFITLAESAHRPHEVRLELPATWKQSMTALPNTAGGQPNHYRAEDFDELVDSPIVAGNPTVATFDVRGCKHFVVGIGATGSWDIHRTTNDIEKIVRAHERCWGFLPFQKYVFLLAFRQGGGGLEHKNSTLVTANAATVQSPCGYPSWLGLVCHEYFHAFNVKRLRPVELGPFDYETAPRTKSLWVAEGLTVYYDELLLTRAGLANADDYLRRLSSHIQQLQKSPGRLAQSLEQSSLDVWTNSMSGLNTNEKSVSYYIKGPVVGFLMDAQIRHATNGQKCLDDVMKLEYKRFSGERGFTEDEFRATAEEAAGTELQNWIKKAVASTEELNYTQALDWFGLTFGSSDVPEKRWQLALRQDASQAQREHLVTWLGSVPSAETDRAPAKLVVAAPPDSVFEKFRERDREVARAFYKKFLDINGVPVLASADVADEALNRTHDLVTHLLAGRADILEAMARAFSVSFYRIAGVSKVISSLVG
jgi:predicted metalloprotease with PDZ domain